MKMIKARQMVVKVTYALDFFNAQGIYAGFDCDKNGNVFMDNLQPVAKKNLEECLASGNRKEVRDYVNRYAEPAEGKCSCGRIVVLHDALTNECGCGKLYNLVGQELNPRSMWEEEY